MPPLLVQTPRKEEWHTVPRADLVGRLWANKKYSKTKQEDCVSSTDTHHCLFVAGPQTPSRAFQDCPTDPERSRHFLYEAKARKGTYVYNTLENRRKGARRLQRQGRQSLATWDTLKNQEQYKNLSSPLNCCAEWWRGLNPYVHEARTCKELAVKRDEI